MGKIELVEKYIDSAKNIHSGERYIQWKKTNSVKKKIVKKIVRKIVEKNIDGRKNTGSGKRYSGKIQRQWKKIQRK